MEPKDNKSSSSPSAPHTKATRDDWIRIALDTLISDGVEKVRVLSLAQRLDVSRSSFYWYFNSRSDLLDTLLDVWRTSNTQAIVKQSRLPSETVTEGILNLFACWVDPDLFNPRLDFAIREWARRSGTVRHVVDQADNERVEAIKEIFLRHEYEATEAFIRARVLYFMQIGYYALDIRETPETRMHYTPAYLKSFTGIEALPGEIPAFAKRYIQRRD
ncbi:TetR/AcrR family transcriptional regulator [Coralliovum pocilloporae]|uniref:TetR/AcrR family transcriptional regulator n=1 Tax=Coralliovum pocilloporae TaxID=3066369 RepID=UPI003306A2CA